MAQIQVTFDQIMNNSGTTVTKDDWYDITGAIPSGSQIWLGYATFISWDKPVTFEIRSNLPGQSTGTTGTTQLRAFTAVNTSDSSDVDMSLDGNISTLCPATAASTGVERVWLRVRSGSATVGAFDYIIYYTTA